MRINPLIRDRAPQPQTAAAPAPNPQPCYVTAAPLEILLEQLEYLAGHVSQACPADCSDCARLSQVTNWLLLPFRTARPTQGHSKLRPMK